MVKFDLPLQSLLKGLTLSRQPILFVLFCTTHEESFQGFFVIAQRIHLLLIDSDASFEVFDLPLNAFHLLKSRNDGIDVLQLEFQHIVNDPNRWIVVLNEVTGVLKLRFICLAVVERAWEGNVFLRIWRWRFKDNRQRLLLFYFWLWRLFFTFAKLLTLPTNSLHDARLFVL